MRALLLVGVLVATLTASTTAQADQVFTVDSTEDRAATGDKTNGVCEAVLDDGDPETEDPTVCTLRAAIQEANGTPGADTVIVPDGGASNYDLTLLQMGDGDSGEEAGDLDISEDLTITGAGQDLVRIDGQRHSTDWVAADKERIFDIQNDAVVSITGVTIRNGSWTGNGGGVKNHGTLTISDSTVFGNEAGEQGGGFYNHRGDVLTLSSVRVENNDARDGGGIYNNSDGPEPESSEADPGPGLLVVDSTLLSNDANASEGGGYGGGIFNDDEARIVDSEIGLSDSGNQADRDGGGIYNDVDTSYGGAAELRLVNSVVEGNQANNNNGGGIYNYGAYVALENSHVDENHAENNGGGIYNGSGGTSVGEVVITGGSVDDNFADTDEEDGAGGGGIYNDGELSATGTSMSENGSDYHGGAVYNGGLSDFTSVLELSLVVIDLNESDGNGGGIYNDAGEVATVTDSTISRNVSGIESDGGGGIWNGGIFRLERSTVSGNGEEDGEVRTYRGGGIYNGGYGWFSYNDAMTAAVMTIVNSTISGNVADREGGGIYNAGLWPPRFDYPEIEALEVVPAPTVTLNHTTITENRANEGSASGFAPDWGGGIYNEAVPPEQQLPLAPGVIKTMNSIIAGNMSQEPEPPTVTTMALIASNCGGEKPVSEGHNLENADTCGFAASGDLKNVVAKLGALAANGGPTHTHELLIDSPALDKAAGGQSCPPTDQRGTTKPQGAGCDIGSYELLVQAPQPPAPAPPPPAVTPPPPPPATVRPPAARPRTPRVVRRCRVPNVRGKTVRQARRAITRAGCRAMVMGRRYSAATRPGRVIGQSVRPGARVRRGTLVRLVLSRGIQPVRPPFTG